MAGRGNEDNNRKKDAKEEDLIILIDEDGNEISYEHLDTIEMNDSEYVVLLEHEEGISGPEAENDTEACKDDVASGGPAPHDDGRAAENSAEDASDDEDEDEDEDEYEDEEGAGESEIIILKIVHGKKGEDSFVSIDNEKELDEVFEEFRRRMDEEYDFET